MALVVVPPEEEEVISYPKLRTVPVLPADYPLFDWEAWPKSYAALKPGTATKQFERACWNAIVDTLGGAMEAAGLEFYRSEDGFTPEDIHLATNRLDVLTAVKMNDLIAAINDVVRFEWPWQYDWSHPGFHPDIWGYGFCGKYTNTKSSPDIVYAQYFLDIVHRLNLILQLMRDNYPDCCELLANSSSTSQVDRTLRKGWGVRINRHLTVSTSLSEQPLRGGWGMKTESQNMSFISFRFWEENLKAGPLRIPRVIMRYPVKFETEKILPAPVFPGWTGITSAAQALVEAINPVDVAFGFSLISQTAANMDKLLMTATGAVTQRKTNLQAQAFSDETLRVRARWSSTSQSQSDADTAKAVNTAAQKRFTSRSSAAMDILWPVYTGAKVLAGSCAVSAEVSGGKLVRLDVSRFRTNSRQQGDLRSVGSAAVTAGREGVTESTAVVLKPRTRPMWALQESEIQTEFAAEYLDSCAVTAGQAGVTQGTCSLGSAWDPPEWYEGGLWIRQAKTWKIRPDGSMDLSGSGDPLGAVLETRTEIVVALDNAWLAPVWVDGGLYLRQIREVKVLEDGSLDLSGAGDELLPMHNSRTNVAAVLDTAWYPPETVDGGLYIRQVQSVVQNENHELEVY